MKFSVIILIIILFSCQSKTEDDYKKTNIHIVEKGQIAIILEESGEVHANKKVEIKSAVSGRILKFYFQEGDFVNKGDTLCILEPDFEQAKRIYGIRSNLKLAKIRLEKAEDVLMKKQLLFTQKFISQDELDSSMDNLEEAKINFKVANQNNKLIAAVDSEQNIYPVVSDATGTIINKKVEESEMIIAGSGAASVGTVLMILADLKKVIVRATISEIDISKIHKKQKATIKVDAYPHDDFTGFIKKISATAIDERGVKVFPIQININETNTKLRPGMTANITIAGELKTDILTIPIRAIFSDADGENIVYKVINDTTIIDVPIKTGINDFLNVEIIKGISVGDSLSLDAKEMKEMEKMKKKKKKKYRK